MRFHALSAVAFVLCLSAAEASKTDRPRPNILLIMIDDLGWTDLHCQGNERLDTPNIDRLARQGMRFTDAYAASPVCSPTRAAIMTGLSPARLRLTNHITTRTFAPKDATVLDADTRQFLPLEYDTLPERLKRAGYATGFFGKWHLAGVPRRHGKGLERYYPEKQGYDVNIGGCAHGGPPSFFDPYRIHNLPDRKPGEYLPDRLADEAIAFLRKNKNKSKPFFLTLWNYTVHWPMQAPKSLVEKYQKRKGPGVKDPRYAAMTEAMDASIGRILKALEAEKLADNTLVIFTSDNGAFLGVADLRPLRLGKGYLYEGGIRVPLIVRWPGVVKPGTVCKTPVISTDFFPTLLQAAGVKSKAGETLDGESLLPVLKQTGRLKRDAIHFHYPNYAWHGSNRLGSAIRKGHYKLIQRADDGSVELYDLSEDLSEKRDLAKSKPQVAAKLKKELAAWLRETKAALPKPVKTGFERRTVEGFTVHVTRAALRENKRETERALEHLANQLFQIKMTVPAKNVRELQQVPIWLANGEKKLGIAFHPNRKWLTDRGYEPPEKRSLIGIVGAKHYLHESLRQPWLAFHELTHGYDWFKLGRRRTYGSSASVYKTAMKSGKYVSALHWNGRMRKPYHATNKMEFFAETSEAFFGTNDIFPFVRAELREHDPETFRVLSSLWNVDVKQIRQTEKELATLLKKRPLITGTQPGASKKSPAEFTATTQYAKRTIEGWAVRVHPDLARNKALATRTLRLLRRDLHYVRRYVPAAAIPALQKTVIWVEHGSANVPYVAYHHSAKWLRANAMNPAKTRGIEIGNPRNYLRWFGQQPSVMLHLLAYRYFDDVVGPKNKPLAAAFQKARKNDKYKTVLQFDGQRVAHPGLRDVREFFADFSVTRFGTNDHYPFVRIELKTADPQLYALLTRLWTPAAR